MGFMSLSALSPPLGARDVPFGNWGVSDSGTIENHMTFITIIRPVGHAGLDQYDIGEHWGWGAATGETIVIQGRVSIDWDAGDIWVGAGEGPANWVNAGPSRASPQPGGTFELRHTVTTEPADTHMRVRSQSGSGNNGTFDITWIGILPSGAPPELQGAHALIDRTGKDVRYSLTAASHPFTADNGTHSLTVVNNQFIQTTVTANGSHGITIPATVFSGAGAQAGDRLEVRGRIINNRVDGGRIALFNSAGNPSNDSDIRGQANLVSPWTIDFALNATDLDGMRLRPNRWHNSGTEQDGFTFTIDDMIIVRPSADLTLTGSHSLLDRADRNVIYSLNAASHPFTASNGTHIFNVQGGNHVTTTVTANGQQGITIPSSVFTGANAQVGDRLEIRGRIVSNRLAPNDGRMALFNAGTGATATGDGDIRAQTGLGSPWTITHTLDAASLSGMRLHPNRWGGTPEGNTDFMFSIDDMIIFRPSADGTPAPIFQPLTAGGQGFTTDSFSNTTNRQIWADAIDGITNTLRISHNDNENWRWGARISFANLGITTPGNYTVSFTYFVPTANVNSRTHIQICATDGGNFDLPGLSGATGDTYRQLTSNAWTTHSVTFNANTSDPGWQSAATLRFQPNGDPGFVNAWYISSIVVVRNFALCPNLSNHLTSSAATCTTGAVVCNVSGCDQFNVPIPALGHDYKPDPNDNTRHICGRTGCTFSANHTTSVPGQTCSLCHFPIPAAGHTHSWSTAVITATCTEGGTSSQYCTANDCDAVLEVTISALGHNVVNGVCTRCNLTPCGMCGVVGNWHWGGNANTHWAGNCNCTGNAPHFFNANGVCICGATGEPSPVPSPCGMCGTVGVWRWQGNEGSHWSSSGCCDLNAPHFFDASGRCICGATGTPSPVISPCGICGTVGPWRWGGNADVHWAENCNCTGNAPHVFNANGVCICGATRAADGTTNTACGICGTVGPWRWGSNADVHWAENCNCTGNAPHVFNANGVCICGATRAPDAASTYTPCGMCGVVGPWRWGGNADAHWAENCNCTGNAPHVFDENGRCICGATRVAAPQESFREEDFIDAEELISDLLQAIEAGEVPTIDLTEASNVTVISADVFLAIADSGVDVVVVLPSGFTFTIIASSITENVGAFDLNIAVYIEQTIAQHITIGGGVVDVSANSLVIKPNFHGEFGFELVFNVTAEQLAYAGIDAETVLHFHVCGVGNVTEMAKPTLNADGSVDIRINHASFHILSNEAPVTLEVGSMVTAPPNIVEETSPGVDTGSSSNNPVAPLQEALAQQSGNRTLWLLILASTVTLLVAAAVTVVMLKHRNNTRAA
jgi:bifunctional DNA-binding transcriptional regulator/antitoxin component of YhaV-PrlF toxin-antitoxin module